MDIWAANIMDHYRHPRNTGQIKSPDFKADGANTSCGDLISVSLSLENERISKIRFISQGCAISQAAMSILSDALIGHSINEVGAYGLDFVEKNIGIKVSDRRQNCALLGLRTIQKAISNKI